jgi:hypothetical protein
MKSRKRILILSSDAGFGHRSSALAIAAALGEQYGDQCQVEVVNPLNEPRCVPACCDAPSKITTAWCETAHKFTAWATK